MKEQNRNINKKENIKKAKKYGQTALKLHEFYKGKIQMMPKCSITSIKDFSIWYTPGVARVSESIYKKKENVFTYTNKWNTVAVVSDGTRVLGLGNIGPEAALPVMEGKALLFKYLGGVDAFPICLDTKDAEKIMETVKYLQPSFGGINLEDIEKPKCFDILERLRNEMDIPVWHDDEQGTAAITLAALLNAIKIVGKKKKDVSIVFFGAGAANVAISRLLFQAGFTSNKSIFVDSKGILSDSRKDLKDTYKWKLVKESNQEDREGDAKEAFKGMDIAICLSRSGPNIVKKEWVSSMASDAIVFACANPIPEIWPWDAKEAGAKIVGTGRSDFPNQVNNSLGFPGIFRGALDVRARSITDEMCITAAKSLAKTAEMQGIDEDYIIPSMNDIDAVINEALAVGLKAISQKIARIRYSKEELHKIVHNTIRASRKSANFLMHYGIIPEKII
ncbi:MAG: malate dehydrogenase [Candidatus Lokiarchaeota archaeon]|nr:malate dehydrogenase [Candidatus Lokiarchaeota archaeon]